MTSDSRLAVTTIWGWEHAEIDSAAVPVRKGVGYPEPFAMLSANRLRQWLGDAGSLTAVGGSFTHLPPGE